MEQNENTLSVLKIAPGQYPQQVEIDNDLKALQQAVGGSIGASYPFEDPVAIVYNDDGKLMGLPLNRALRDENGEMYVVTDPKGTIVLECGNAMLKNGYKVRILNTINFKKSMHYNPFSYVHSEKDILKLITTLMTNTKGEGSGGDPFWEKSERLLLTALIAYLHYEAPAEEQNFATLLEMLNTMQVLEDDEEYQNPVDLLFEELAKKKPNSFAGRQYKLYKLAAGDICSK